MNGGYDGSSTWTFPDFMWNYLIAMFYLYKSIKKNYLCQDITSQHNLLLLISRWYPMMWYIINWYEDMRGRPYKFHAEVWNKKATQRYSNYYCIASSSLLNLWKLLEYLYVYILTYWHEAAMKIHMIEVNSQNRQDKVW